LVEQTGMPCGGERESEERERVSERPSPRGVVITEARGARNADVD
jgi:hypothetical protein